MNIPVLLSLLSMLLLSTTWSVEASCSELGHCVGYSLDVTMAASGEACLDFCRNTADCTWYTFDHVDKFCSAFKNCSTLDTTCKSCVSGEITCEEGYSCAVNGECHGILLHHERSWSPYDCQQVCMGRSECAWYSYYPSYRYCLMLRSCDMDANSDCQDCISGESECHMSTVAVTSKVLIVGEFNPSNPWTTGSPSGTSTTLINLPMTESRTSCPPPQPFPTPVANSVSAIIDGKVVVCGGGDGTAMDQPYAFQTFLSSCYSLDPETGSWVTFPSLPEPRRFAAAVVTSFGWWVLGGEYGDHTMSSTALYNSLTGSWEAGVALPVPMSRHCATLVSGGDIFVFGAGPTAPLPYLFSAATQTWTSLSATPGPASAMGTLDCTFLRKGSNDSGIVLIAVSSPPHVSSFNLATKEWRPFLPFISPTPSVQPQSRSYFTLDRLGLTLVSPSTDSVLHIDNSYLDYAGTMPGPIPMPPPVPIDNGTNGVRVGAVAIAVADSQLYGCTESTVSA